MKKITTKIVRYIIKTSAKLSKTVSVETNSRSNYFTRKKTQSENLKVHLDTPFIAGICPVKCLDSLFRVSKYFLYFCHKRFITKISICFSEFRGRMQTY